jgi:restriction endonuclease S subunit
MERIKETNPNNSNIPNRFSGEWVEKKLGEISKIKTGKKNEKDNDPYGKYPFFVRSTEILHINSYSFEGEAILLPGEGGIGNILHYINGRFDYHQRVYKISNFDNSVCCRYLYYYMRIFFHIHVTAMAVKATVDSLRLPTIEQFFIKLPPTIEEQKAIAEVLSDVDSLISSINKKIEKEKAIKQGMMEQLLTGKKRLTGFSGEWIEKKLGEIGNTYNGLTGKSKEDFGIGNAWYITFLNILNNPIIDITNFERVRINKNEVQNKAERGDLFFNTSSETPEEVGICSILLNNVNDLYLNSFCFGYRLRDNNINGLFLSYYFRCSLGRNLMMMLAQGATRYNLSKLSFKESIIKLPPTIEEQNAIAEVLSDVDNEILKLEHLLDKYKSIKLAMMQKLLTGEIRLINEKEKLPNETFKRTVLAAGIIDNLYNEPTFGHVKFEKCFFIIDKMCGLGFGSYHREVAGPYDNKVLYSVEKQLSKAKWFGVVSNNTRYKYYPLEKKEQYKQYFNRYFTDIKPIFDKIIQTFKTWDTEHCEIVATLYSAWEDLLKTGQEFTDKDIVHEVLYNWTESKKRITEERWLAALKWMRDNEFIPQNK